VSRRPILKAPLRAPSTNGAIEPGFPEGDLSFSVRSTRLNIDHYFFKVFTKRLLPLEKTNLLTKAFDFLHQVHHEFDPRHIHATSPAQIFDPPDNVDSTVVKIPAA